ncbi:MAG: sigma-70 family RNA polymerase sigma factor [Phycisphaerales bacterium]
MRYISHTAATPPPISAHFPHSLKPVSYTHEPTRPTLLSRVRDPANAVAWREFQDRYRDLLLRFCLSRGVQHADAEDVVQTVFAGLARALPGFTYDPRKGRFRDYLFRCVRNAISTQHRPNQLTTSLDPSDGITPDGRTPPSAQDVEAQLWEKEWVAHHYRLAVSTLRTTFDAQSIEVFEHALAGLSPAATAERMGLTTEAVYKARQRVRSRLQELVAKQIEEEDDPDRTA